MPEPNPLAGVLELPGVAAALAQARADVDLLLAHRVLRRGSAAVSAESALRGARASAALEGAGAALSDVRRGDGGPVVRGALRASAELGSMVDTWGRAPAQVLARLHVLAAREMAPAVKLGRPVADAEVGRRLDALAGLVTSDAAGPALLLAAVVHGELLILAPFGVADGIVARAASRLCLISRGLDPKGVSVPEAGHLELASSYSDSAAAYRSGEREGVAVWVKHCCAAVGFGAREGLAICEAAARG